MKLIRCTRPRGNVPLILDTMLSKVFDSRLVGVKLIVIRNMEMKKLHPPTW